MGLPMELLEKPEIEMVHIANYFRNITAEFSARLVALGWAQGPMRQVKMLADKIGEEGEDKANLAFADAPATISPSTRKQALIQRRRRRGIETHAVAR